MNDIGADKNKVLVISLDGGKTYICDIAGFLLYFDTYKQIGEYCWLNSIDTDDITIHELDTILDETIESVKIEGGEKNDKRIE